jgi:hypothetical protein
MNQPLDRSTLNSYLTTILWSSTCIGGEYESECDSFLDENYDIDDISPEFVATSIEDLNDFFELTASLFVDTNHTKEQIAHDFWLTRCGHGAGFWDGDYGDIGDKLTELTKPYGNIDPYVGDDNLIYG